jgi:hypothetical protein
LFSEVLFLIGTPLFRLLYSSEVAAALVNTSR